MGASDSPSLLQWTMLWHKSMYLRRDNRAMQDQMIIGAFWEMSEGCGMACHCSNFSRHTKLVTSTVGGKIPLGFEFCFLETFFSCFYIIYFPSAYNFLLFYYSCSPTECIVGGPMCSRWMCLLIFDNYYKYILMGMKYCFPSTVLHFPRWSPQNLVLAISW